MCLPVCPRSQGTKPRQARLSQRAKSHAPFPSSTRQSHTSHTILYCVVLYCTVTLAGKRKKKKNEGPSLLTASAWASLILLNHKGPQATGHQARRVAIRQAMAAASTASMYSMFRITAGCCSSMARPRLHLLPAAARDICRAFSDSRPRSNISSGNEKPIPEVSWGTAPSVCLLRAIVTERN